jgi:hypothetical protein
VRAGLALDPQGLLKGMPGLANLTWMEGRLQRRSGTCAHSPPTHVVEMTSRVCHTACMGRRHGAAIGPARRRGDADS